jgi:hypothetical protein
MEHRRDHVDSERLPQTATVDCESTGRRLIEFRRLFVVGAIAVQQS